MIRSNRPTPTWLQAAVARLLAAVAGLLLLGSALHAADPAAELKKVVDDAVSKLKELNPGFDGGLGYRADGGAVTEIRLVTDKVTDITPLRAFDKLSVLSCPGTHVNWARGNGQLADLSPLKGLNLAGLTGLDLSFTRVGDAGMIDDRHQGFGGRRKLRETFDRGGGGDGRSDEDAGHAASGEHLGLADLRATDADRPRRHLAPGDVDALVRLGVRAKRDAALGHERGHAPDVTVERIDIEDESGGIQIGARALPADQMIMQFAIGGHANNISRWE